jgi:glycosyltransferase involved in cell wall biosynthesis
MNILYLEHYAGSPDMGMEFRPYYLSREWVKAGHNVTIIAGEYSHLRKKNPKIEKDFTREKIDGIEYVWVKTGEYTGNGMKRALTMERFVRKLMRNARKIANTWKPDVVIASSTYPLDTYPAQKIAKYTKAKYIHEVHDMWPSTLYEVGGMSRHNPFVMVMQRGENSAYKHADAVVSLPPYAGEYMKQHGLREGRFFHVPNGIVTEEWESSQALPEEHRALFAKLREEKRFIVGYFGGHALSNCLGTLIESAKQTKDEEVHFVLVGDGVEKANLMASAAGLKNISFLPAIGKRAVPTLVQQFDCIYIGAKDSPLYRFGVCMNKMYDGMMAGRPIVFAINAPLTPVEEYKCGVIVPPENPAEIINAVAQIKSMTPAEREETGNRGREAVLKNFTYEKLAATFADIMVKCEEL